jgi:hypothetical protein
MNQKERLVELLRKDNCCIDYDCNKCLSNIHCYPKTVADLILADGWFRPHCKVGQTVFCIIDGFDSVMEGRVRFYTVHKDCIIYEVAINGYYAQRYTNKDFGYKIFYEREDAEKALRGDEENEKAL